MEPNTKRAESRAEQDPDKGILFAWVEEPDSMCPDRFQNCYGPITAITFYFSIFDWRYLLGLPYCYFNIV